ncbi:MAG TPA: exodeoxyribonuclease VII small subunit [bacterium]|nr:exodeoxyribonuclease VII small subunit [bacterium]
MTEKRTFEKSMAELEGVVKQLEGGNLPLEDSMKAFERGVGLARECEALLGEAKGKIEKLVRDAGGSLKAEAFEPAERDQ